ncbi:M3K1-like protein [Mya arenaria]|uniref:M3K1-like protein n=1 Tax=Mya arenaria TaxID=6604 RepID=A0ABY7D8P2_MYAAR|nr:uncharacterized protein LOC128238899 [Mya arenaria]XP_052811181.1 uncharacterized protein LOC128238899 [Mya arenaria]XP_052811190.1 uncharacterized protein LOC128238899 [Mya arenaria]WAQ94042.1 M3K1-like protein [Mya arenaria]
MDELGISVRDRGADTGSLGVKGMYNGGGALPILPSDTKVESTDTKLRLDTQLRDTSWNFSKTRPLVVPASPDIHGASGGHFNRSFESKTEFSKCFDADFDEKLEEKRTADLKGFGYGSCTELQTKTGKYVPILDDDVESMIDLRGRDVSPSLTDTLKTIEKKPQAVESDVVDIHGCKSQQFICVAGRIQPNETLAVSEQFLDLPTPQVVTEDFFVKSKKADPAESGSLQTEPEDEHITPAQIDEAEIKGDEYYLPEEDESDEYIPKVGDKLGEGGQGTVVLGQLPETGELAAIKQVWLSKGDAALLKEYEIAMDLKRHPNIIHVYKAERRGDNFYTYMEYMKDGAVNQWEWTAEQVVYILQEVLKGLIHMHSLGILHRDIKGENVLVSFDGDKNNIKIADLGSAVYAPWNGTCYADVVDYGFQGTVPFIPKEVASKHQFSTASDIWAVGCLGIELLTGELPWSDCKLRNTGALLFKIGMTDTPPPLPPDIDIPEHLKDFLLQCLQIDPRDRPSASELVQHAVFAGDPEE